MDCICYNIMNSIQTSLANLIRAAAQNRINSDLSSTDDGNYQPNLNLLNNNNSNTSYDFNMFFYFIIILITFFSFASIYNNRRRRIGGNGSALD